MQVDVHSFVEDAHDVDPLVGDAIEDPMPFHGEPAVSFPQEAEVGTGKWVVTQPCDSGIEPIEIDVRLLGSPSLRRVQPDAEEVVPGAIASVDLKRHEPPWH